MDDLGMETLTNWQIAFRHLGGQVWEKHGKRRIYIGWVEASGADCYLDRRGKPRAVNVGGRKITEKQVNAWKLSKVWIDSSDDVVRTRGLPDFVIEEILKTFKTIGSTRLKTEAQNPMGEPMPAPIRYRVASTRRKTWATASNPKRETFDEMVARFKAAKER